MKIRNGFVSNSSSSSFVVSLSKLCDRDLDILLEYETVARKNGEYNDSWNIVVDDNKGIVRGFTSMDNDDLSEYLENNKVDTSLFVWEGENY